MVRHTVPRQKYHSAGKAVALFSRVNIFILIKKKFSRQLYFLQQLKINFARNNPDKCTSQSRHLNYSVTIFIQCLFIKEAD